MSLVAARRSQDDLRLEVDAGSSLISGSRSDVQVSHREALFAYKLVATAPEVLKYQTIEVQILHPDGIGLPPSDPMTYIRKLKLAVDRGIEEATGERGLIVSVRGVGYRLTGQWALSFPRHERDVAETFANLNLLATQCIGLMKNIPLVEVDGGSRILDTRECKESAMAIAGKFELLVAELHESLQASPRRAGLDAHIYVLRDIHSYFTFRRQGNVDEETWRRLFEVELNRKIHELREQLRQPVTRNMLD